MGVSRIIVRGGDGFPRRIRDGCHVVVLREASRAVDRPGEAPMQGNSPGSFTAKYTVGSASPRKGGSHATLKSNKTSTFSEQPNIRKHLICLQILNLELQASLTQRFAYLKQLFNEAIS